MRCLNFLRLLKFILRIFFFTHRWWPCKQDVLGLFDLMPRT